MKKVYLIAVVFALIAGFATYMFASEINKKTTIKDADTVTVYVPVEDVEANTAITEEMFAEDANYFTTKTVLAADQTPNAVTSTEQLVGMVTVDKLYAGEQINAGRLESADGEDVALSIKLPKGKVAYSISAASVTSVDGYICEGDTVDVIVYRDDEKGNEKSEIAYKGLKVIKVSTNTDNAKATKNGSAVTEYSSLTVEVTKEQALELYDIENTYSYKLILNPRG